MTQKETQEVRALLRYTRGRIAEGWRRFGSAQDAHGRSCSLYSLEARQFCLYGALVRSLADLQLSWRVYERALSLFEKNTHDLTQYNDYVARDVDDVLALLDRAMP
jgi:hypothetical protein